MEHLVEGHMGGYWIDTRDIKDIEEYCEECGDFDRVILSWQEGHMMESLKEFYSCDRFSKDFIEWHYNNGTTRPEIIEIILYSYEEDKIILSSLLEDNNITAEEHRELLGIIKKTQKKQIATALEVYKTPYKEDSSKTLKKVIRKNNRKN